MDLKDKAMFKQPDGNTNATAADRRRSSERLNRKIDSADERSEIEAEARRIAADRGNKDSVSDEDRERASRIVQNRKISLSKA